MLHKLDRQHVRIVFLQDALLLVFLHDIRIADIKGLQIVAVALCIAVHIISAEKLVRPLTGVAELCMLRRLIAGNRKCDRRGVAQRLLHVVHYIRNNREIFFRRNQAPQILPPQDIRRLLRQPGLVEPRFVITAGI